MRPRIISTASILMLVAMLYSSAGPQVCRALMATEAVAATVKCCGDGSEPTSGTESSGGEHESCPLHRLSLIELLPAPPETKAPDAPQSVVETPADFVSSSAMLTPTSAQIIALDSGPPSSPSRSLFLVHRNIRR